MQVIGIIPSRYASTRFPGKPLVDIKGKTMIQRVYEQASKASSLATVVVATDDQRIFDHVQGFGGNVAMTSEDHESGTDRCFEALQNFGGDYDAVVNIQGDEPFIQPSQIEKVISCFENESTQIATLVRVITDAEELHNPNQVKAVIDTHKKAVYFSRQPIPYLKGVDLNDWPSLHTYYGHLGLYAYRTSALGEITQLAPSSLEKAESLEQLRWLENGYHISVEITDIPSVGIDTPEDLERLLPTIE